MTDTTNVRMRDVLKAHELRIQPSGGVCSCGKWTERPYGSLLWGPDDWEEHLEEALEAAGALHAAEVKVLTETASKVGYALGRKDAGEEIAEGIEAVRDSVGLFPIANPDDLLTSHQAWTNAAQIARDVTSQPSEGASDERSGVGGHQEVSETARSPQEPCGCLLGPLHTEADHRDLTKGDG